MSKLPSERINEILGEFTLKRGSVKTPSEDVGRLFESIIDFLDETAKEKECEHKSWKDNFKLSTCTKTNGNDLCTNGKDTYHNYNLYHYGRCAFCETRLV